MKSNGYLKKIPMFIFLALLAAWSGYVIFKYAFFAFTEPPVTSESPVVIQRGSILDRNGKALAVPTNFYNFGATPSAFQKDKSEKSVANFAKLVASSLGMSQQEIISIIEEAARPNFTYIKKKIDQATYEEVKKICSRNGFNGCVTFEKIPGRIYPENDLASQLIGFMGDGGQGRSGIEYSMQDVLSPEDTKTSEIIQGKNVFLTIDANLQSNLEKIAHEALETTQAANLMLIAAESKTGEILSYISLPSANLNDYTSADIESKKDRPAMDAYEPGSVFKIFSVASFLDSNAISKKDIFNCDGVFEKTTSSGEKFTIKCLDHHGWQTAREALKFSCNDALAQMSDKIESEPFLDRLRSFGFGSKPGTEVPGETAGKVKETSDRLWSARSRPTIAIGQEITVSALQMVQAATAIANGGIPVQLTFISRITDEKGQDEFVHTPIYKDRILKSSTTEYILSCMETVAQSGTGHRASIGDVSIGVKTGTAQMADPVNGGYSKTDFISNCIAIFPVENPEIILYIVIEKAKGENYAGRIVAPVINQAANAIIDHLGMSRGNASSLANSSSISIPGDAPIKIEKTLPDFTGKSKRQLLQLLDRPDIHIQINGDGWVTSQNPPPGTPVTENMEIELYLE